MKIESKNITVTVESGCADCPFCHFAMDEKTCYILGKIAIEPMNYQCPLKTSEVIVKFNREY